MFSPNDMLLDQTMLCEASRLLENFPQGGVFASHSLNYPLASSRWPISNAERLFNLSMLLDGLALHNHVYVLGAELPLDATIFRQLLMQKDILKQIETAPYLSKIHQELRFFLSELELLSKGKGSRGYGDIRPGTTERIGQAIVSFLNNTHDDDPILECLRRDYDILLSENVGSQPLLTLGEYLLRDISYFWSGTAVTGVSLLRTFVYWRISEHAKIALYPSSRRIPQIAALTNHVRLFAAEKIYQIVAKAFKENVRLVYEDEEQFPLFLPPSLSIFLDLYRSSHDLSRTIDDFRHEFAGVRQNFHSLEEKLVNVKTLQERIELKHQLSEIMKALSTHYQLNDDSALETVLGFVPEVLNPLTNPADPSKYSSALLTKPVEWVKNWWRQRPFQHVFHLRERLYQISRYENLASEVLGADFSNPEHHHNFYEYYNKYLALYSGQG